MKMVFVLRWERYVPIHMLVDINFDKRMSVRISNQGWANFERNENWSLVLYTNSKFRLNKQIARKYTQTNGYMYDIWSISYALFIYILVMSISYSNHLFICHFIKFYMLMGIYEYHITCCWICINFDLFNSWFMVICVFLSKFHKNDHERWMCDESSVVGKWTLNFHVLSLSKKLSKKTFRKMTIFSGNKTEKKS